MLNEFQSKVRQIINERKYKNSFKKAMSCNRHERRALAKINGIAKIPSNH